MTEQMGQTQTNKKPIWRRWWFITLAVLIAIAIIGNFLPDEEDDGPSTAISTPTVDATQPTSTSDATTPPNAETTKPRAASKRKPSEPPFDKEAHAAAIEKAYLQGMMRDSFSDICGGTYDKWQCFYDRLETKSRARVDVHLSFPGDVTKAERKEYAKQSRLHLFNFVGSDYPELDTIVSFDNGVDSGTTYRRDVPLLN